MLINCLVVAEKLLVCEWLKHSNQTLAFTLTLKLFKSVNYVPTSVSLHRVAWTRIQKRRPWIWFFYFSMIIRWKSNFKIQYTSWSRTFCNLMISLNVCKDVVFVVPFSQDHMGTYWVQHILTTSLIQKSFVHTQPDICWKRRVFTPSTK